MAVIQPRPLMNSSEQKSSSWPRRSPSPPSLMTNRVHQPLNFSIDDRLSERHLTQLDLRSKNLKKIDKFSTHVQFNVILLDNNEIIKVEHLDIFTQLIELSIAQNRLIDISLVARLKSLRKLNLANNSIDSIDALKHLTNLTILNISANNIDNLTPLHACLNLQYLDASDNSIREIEDLSPIKGLKYLNLHRNLIDRLNFIGKCGLKSLHTLILSGNEINDLTEISFLSTLSGLKVFKIKSNPCLFVIDERHGCHQPFDYRPYVLNWCLSLENLDDISVTRRESLKAEWLLTQGKGRSFRNGEHFELVQYLTKICGTDADERDDLHISRVMVEQDFHQPQRSTERKSTRFDPTVYSSQDCQNKFQRSLLISESEFVQISPCSSADEIKHPVLSEIHRRNSGTRSEEPTSHNPYSEYDNRPIKPLNQQTFQSELSQYPVDNGSTRSARHSPKTTSQGPTSSTAMQVKIRSKSKKNISTERHAIAGTNEPKKINKNTLKSANVEVQQKSMVNQTTDSHFLQAYLDLHQHFTKTTELQTSALVLLWKKFEDQQNHIEKITAENDSLKQRLKTFENLSKSSTLKDSILHPPLRAHTSKRDTKSFFLHWSLNPLNENNVLLGYRIFIDDILKATTDANQNQTIIDWIRDEGEYKITVRAFNDHGESEDSNLVVTRFRRQRSDSNPSEIKPNLSLQRTQSDRTLHQSDRQQSSSLLQTYPRSLENDSNEKKMRPSDNDSASASSPSNSNPVVSSDENFLQRKPPSIQQPKFDVGQIDSNNKQQSPTKAGLMSRLIRHAHKVKRNNVLLNALPMNLAAIPVETNLRFSSEFSGKNSLSD